MGGDGHCQSRRIHRRRDSALVDEIIVLKNGSLAKRGSNWLRAPRFRSPPHTSLRPNWWVGVVLERVEGGGYQTGCGCGKSVRRLTRENVRLAILDGTVALYIEKITGRGAAKVASRRGGRLPLLATGVGKVQLAYGPGDLFAEVMANGLTRYTPHTMPCRDTFDEP